MKQNEKQEEKPKTYKDKKIGINTAISLLGIGNRDVLFLTKKFGSAENTYSQWKSLIVPTGVVITER